MRVVFLGSPPFAVPSLVSLAEHDKIDIALVVTQPDRLAGRGRRLAPPAVKTAALDLGLPVFQPESLRDEHAVQTLRDVQPDLLIVVAYGELLRRNVLELTPDGCLNVHPSLLPRYRGASPIPAVILNGDNMTGVSVMQLVRKLDAGPIVAQVEIDVRPDDTTGSLSDRLAGVAARLLPDVALNYVAGALPPVPQDDESATHTREWTTLDARVNWSQPAQQIERLVRAANPWPMAWTTLNGDRLRIVAANALESTATTSAANDPPGIVTSDRGIVVVTTGTYSLHLVEVQPAGKRSMPAGDWWRGVRADSLLLDT